MKYYLHLSSPDCNLSLGLFQLVLIRFFLRNRTVSHDHLKALRKFLFLKYTKSLIGSVFARTVVAQHVRYAESAYLLYERTLQIPRTHVTSSHEISRTTNHFAGLFIRVNGAAPGAFNLIAHAASFFFLYLHHDMKKTRGSKVMQLLELGSSCNWLLNF